MKVALTVEAEFIRRFKGFFENLIFSLIDNAIDITLILQDIIDSTSLNIPIPENKILRYKHTILLTKYKSQVNDISEKLKRNKVELIHSLSGSASILTGDIAKRLDIPYIVSIIGLEQRECHIPTNKDLCKVLIALSRPILDEIKEMYPNILSKLIRPGEFLQERKQDDEKTKKTFIAYGRFDRLSRYDYIIEAFADLKDKEYDFILVFLGDGPLQSNIYKLVSKYNLKENVVFLEPIVVGWEQLLTEIDAFILARNEYMLEDPPYKAISSGAPIIGPENNIYDIIINGRTARTYKDNNIDELKEIILSTYTEPDNWKELSRNAILFAEENLSIIKISEKIIETYKEATEVTKPLTTEDLQP